MSFNVTEAERQALRARLKYLWILALGAFLLLGQRFFWLQVIRHNEFTDFEKKMQVRPRRIQPMRGDIFDRNHNVLAESQPGCDVAVVPADVTKDAISRLASILGIAPQTISERIEKNQSWYSFTPAVVEENLEDEEKRAQIWVNNLEMPGVRIEQRPVRRYNADSALVSHLIGHLGEVSQEELDHPDNWDLKMGDWIGKSGLEKRLEVELRGRSGTVYTLQDARGREVTAESAPSDLRARADYLDRIKEIEAMKTPMFPGYAVFLTIDIRLMRIARDRLEAARLAGPDEDLRGSVVVMDVRTGELLCLLSVPNYDPALFVARITPETWKELSESESKPLLNRALQGQYPPASAFKIVVAAGALEEDIISPDHQMTCNGSYKLGDAQYRCWNKYGHGRVALEQALVQSCDVYFYRLADSVADVDLIARWARRFGLGRPVLEGMLSEQSGLIPDPQWKKKSKNRPWYRGETINMSIGQGYTLVTPLQAVLIPAAVANNGVLMQPQLVQHFENVERLGLTKFSPRVLAKVMSPGTAHFLRTAMEEVVSDPNGTGYKYARSDRIKIAGKTGTAELGLRKCKQYRGVAVEQIPYKCRDHAWFVGYAPADEPKIAIAVFIEHGGSGGATAGPVAKGIIEDYLLDLEARREPITP